MNNQALVDRYRCPAQFAATALTAPLADEAGYFRFGDNIVCYGPVSSGSPAPSVNGSLCDLASHVRIAAGRILLPFDPVQVIDNLTHERYADPRDGGAPAAAPGSFARDLYYLARPALPSCIRRCVQRTYFRGWEKLPFPRWPLDLTVEHLFERLLALAIEAAGVDEIPFIWFWPDGADAAAIMTHDVETVRGRDFCTAIMDIDESFGIRSSFQLVPEQRYSISPAFLDDIALRGHDINLQDLNHDGLLFQDRTRFLNRARRINNYARQFGARGFRAAVLYRNLEWLGDLNFEYDMSVPNVGHLEAQRGGCCTVFPYFIGNILELPVTTTQDYTLFHILRTYNLDLWKSQLAAITAKHGLAHFITHPDYLRENRARDLYRDLLVMLCRERDERELWIATPTEVNQWWRQRSRMTLVCKNGAWRVEGPGRERAQIAYARASGGNITYVRDVRVPLSN